MRRAREAGAAMASWCSPLLLSSSLSRSAASCWSHEASAPHVWPWRCWHCRAVRLGDPFNEDFRQLKPWSGAPLVADSSGPSIITTRSCILGLGFVMTSQAQASELAHVATDPSSVGADAPQSEESFAGTSAAMTSCSPPRPKAWQRALASATPLQATGSMGPSAAARQGSCEGEHSNGVVAALGLHAGRRSEVCRSSISNAARRGPNSVASSCINRASTEATFDASSCNSARLEAWPRHSLRHALVSSTVACSWATPAASTPACCCCAASLLHNDSMSFCKSALSVPCMVSTMAITSWLIWLCKDRCNVADRSCKSVSGTAGCCCFGRFCAANASDDASLAPRLLDLEIAGSNTTPPSPVTKACSRHAASISLGSVSSSDHAYASSGGEESKICFTLGMAVATAFQTKAQDDEQGGAKSSIVLRNRLKMRWKGNHQIHGPTGGSVHGSSCPRTWLRA
mmetsp:Transcript_86197/g.278998  ORF Transcript_86197/g.278998 Transcript_86197/m.278998 type:complete len:458 (+) Transcript_86197:890-2263(+)